MRHLLLFYLLAMAILAKVPSSLAAFDTSAETRVEETQVETFDWRAEQLRSYLNKHNSPLTEYANDFVEVADQYDINWTLLPAISGVESTFGKRYPKWSYNTFGWGIYGDQVLSFKSHRDAMEAVATGLSQKYPKEALQNIKLLGKIYNGVTPGSWSAKVAYFMEKIESHPHQISLLQIWF
jgi:hypothetical protein